MGERSSAYKVSAEKTEEKVPHGKPSHRYEHGTEMDLQETGWGDADGIDLAQDRDKWRVFVNTAMNLRIP
jgi:hypothetical protein